jgi:thioredoxin 2
MTESLHIVCPHCHTTNRVRADQLASAPGYVQAAAQLEPNVRVAKVDTESQQALGSRYQIRSIPTLALFVNGREVARQAGAMSASDIVRWTRQNIPD